MRRAEQGEVNGKPSDTSSFIGSGIFGMLGCTNNSELTRAKAEQMIKAQKFMAERVGFEPTLEFPLNTLSKRAPSATRPSLQRYLVSLNLP